MDTHDIVWNAEWGMPQSRIRFAGEAECALFFIRHSAFATPHSRYRK